MPFHMLSVLKAPLQKCQQMLPINQKDPKVRRLRVICGGVGNSPWYGQHFSPIKNCEILLSVEGFDIALNDPLNSASWIRIANVLLPLIEKNEKFRITFNKLLKLILNHKSIHNRDEFLLNIWKRAEFSNFPLELTNREEFVKKEPKYIEMKIINIVEEVVNKNSLKPDEINECWKNNDSYSVLIKWCLESTVIFSIVTSIMNEILFRFAGHKHFVTILILIKYFVRNLLNKCQLYGKDFVKLYPWQYRHLVYLLKCEFTNDEEYIEKQIVPIIQDELESKPEVIIALFSHHLV